MPCLVHFDDRTSSITLQLVTNTLKEAFSSMTLDFGHSEEALIVHRHDRLSRRTLTNPSPVAHFLAPRATEGLANDTPFLLPGNVSLPFDLGCNNCSGKGEVIFSTVHFEFNNVFNNPDDDLVKSGAAQIDLKGFEMSIGLRAAPEDDETRTIPVFSKTIIGAEIPGVASIGLRFELELEFKAELDRPVQLGFGFDVVVPDSYIRADLAETQNSGIYGFNPDITAQPLQSNVSDVEVFLLAGLKTSLPVGLKFLGIDALSIGPFLSLPTFNMNVTQLAAADFGADCEPSNATNSADAFRDAFANLTHVEYNIGIGGGMDLPLWLPDITFASADFPLATQCLVYQTEGSSTGLALATAVLASITAPPAATGSQAHGEDATSGSLRYTGTWYNGYAPAVAASISTLITLLFAVA
ncbi:hypothetical protein BU26DRAFT_598755 [Trematosphaeria pertusa]|uniref:DUF7223 domain-containing protein n=1 Tax=Trematosphaeria pertusa TaxID=390896 RepID=A0A6A6J0U2_9PLEO|nr:uncharacterized protein BU26DRAFT_598755 [Trematosphaeria pertusa]KAF2255937.1 hypothetical protein BU26DRAFT_598755 [Trematosphaeria pertusa]